MKKITLEDCRKLKEDFDNYCETAEQHEFISLFRNSGKRGLRGLKYNHQI